MLHRSVRALAVVVIVGCGDDAGTTSAGDDTDIGTTTTTSEDPGTTGDSTSTSTSTPPTTSTSSSTSGESSEGSSTGEPQTSGSESSSTASEDSTTGGPFCGDGVIDEGEECDDGVANSDTEPDACRSNCVVAGCGDGTIDSREACDDGDANSDVTPDACRTTCTLHFCGDLVTDTDEGCDDGDDDWGDSCYACSDRLYYVLNAPSTSSAGNDSIVRATWEGDSVVVVAPNAAYNGTRELELEPDGSRLYALQSHFGLGVHRIIVFDAETGVELDELGVGGSAMARGTDGLLYVTNGSQLIAVDPTDGDTNVVLSFPGMFIGDMTADDNGSFYITNAQDHTVRIATPAFDSFAVWADAADGLDTPFGITYDADTDQIWVGNSRPSIEAQVVEFVGDVDQPAITIAGYDQPQLRGLLIDDDGTPLAPLGDEDIVVAVAPDGTSTEAFAENIDWPVDIKVLDFAP